MRIKMTFANLNGQDIILPVRSTKYFLHYLIYSTFSEQMAKKLYLEGFPINGRKFKLFVFSDILERGKLIRNKHINFGKQITFYFSSPLDNVLDDFGENVIQKKSIPFNALHLHLEKIFFEEEYVFSDDILVHTLSPITEYSTFDHNGKKLRYYYRPTESEFKNLIEENAKKKYVIIKQAQGMSVDENAVKDLHLDIEPYRFSLKKDEKIVYFKGTVIRGYTGVYRLTGSPELIKTTFNAGLGAQSSQGFGMWEVWNNNTEVKNA